MCGQIMNVQENSVPDAVRDHHSVLKPIEDSLYSLPISSPPCMTKRLRRYCEFPAETSISKTNPTSKDGYEDLEEIDLFLKSLNNRIEA